AVRCQPARPWSAAAVRLLQVERRIFRRRRPGLAMPTDAIAEAPRPRAPDLQLDLSGVAAASLVPTVRLDFDGQPSDFAVVSALAAGRLPRLEAVLQDGTVVGRADPMVDRRETVALGAEDVLARAVTLAVAVVARFDGG